VTEGLPTFRDVVAAAGRLERRILRTPALRSDAFDRRTDLRVTFKCENLQVGGAFKLRGATNALLARGTPVPARVATHSSGNHGAALALAARTLGAEATVVMPNDSARVKVEAVRRAGGSVVFCEPGLAERERALGSWLRAHPAHVVHPFDDPDVIAGQGTAALELLCDAGPFEVLVVPVGGGGLIGGTALAAHGAAPGCEVVGVEPELADDAFRSLASGQREQAGVPQTIADGLRGSIGARNFALLRTHVTRIVRVSEAEIVHAMRVVLEDVALLVEPSAAVAVAAALAGGLAPAGARVGILLSGGNVDLDACPFLAGRCGVVPGAG
jgi:threonine dehydratase